MKQFKQQGCETLLTSIYTSAKQKGIDLCGLIFITGKWTESRTFFRKDNVDIEFNDITLQYFNVINMSITVTYTNDSGKHFKTKFSMKSTYALLPGITDYIKSYLYSIFHYNMSKHMKENGCSDFSIIDHEVLYDVDPCKYVKCIDYDKTKDDIVTISSYDDEGIRDEELKMKIICDDIR